MRRTKFVCRLVLLTVVLFTLYCLKSDNLFNKSSDVDSVQETKSEIFHDRRSHFLSTTDQRWSSPHLTEDGSTKIANTTASILQDLQRCSREMGIPQLSLLRNKDTMAEVGRRASLFLENISLLLPVNFSRSYRNPCWKVERPQGLTPGWQSMMMSYFHPGYGKRPHKKMAGTFSPFLFKPADEKSKHKSLLCLPHFFLAGFPKSATTTLHEALGEHPQIVTPTEKEPHWWTRGLALSKSESFDTDFLCISLITYTLFFTTISSELSAGSFLHNSIQDLITYDGSQSTLWDSNFYYNDQDYCAMPAVMSRVLPNAKFIVVMRNPVTRLYSHFLYSCQIHYGNINSWPAAVRNKGPYLFHTKVSKDVQAFNECLKNMSVFECTSFMTSTRRSKSLEGSETEHLKCGVVWHRLAIGLYAVHLRKWLQFYPMENFLFIRMEDISKDPFGTMSRITQFLDVAPVSRKMAEDMLGENQNVLKDKLQASQPMERRTKEFLKEFYEPYNQELAKILNDERFLWHDLI